MRFALLVSIFCGAIAAQQSPGLIQFLSLTPSQVASVIQLNIVYTEFVRSKTAREYTVQAELNAEYAKPSASPLALGQRYIEIDSIERELTLAAADLQAKVTALLTPAQIGLVRQISAASVLRDLNYDASCGYLEPSILAPTFFPGTFSLITPSGSSLANFVLGYPAASYCPAAYPISIRNYLSLTDAQVSAILALEAAYNSLKLRKDNRTADVQVEIRDETAKPVPDPLALGARYAELVEISQELKQADESGRMAARNLLTPTQQDKLKGLMDASAVSTYQFAAASCHFLSLPNFGTTQCQLN